MKYRCLVVDHDDTVVNSTATVHYPAFLAFMEEQKKTHAFTLEDYFALNFEPGVLGFFHDICGLTDEEMEVEEAFWKEYVKTRIPVAFPGMKEILWEHKKKGGILCVSSHSFSDYIYRDYAENGLPKPDMVFGLDMDPELRKPNPYALKEMQKAFSLSPEEMLMLDDLKPGYDMAREAGVPFAAAGWAIDVPSIEGFMRKNCDFYFKRVAELAEFLAQ